MLLCRKNLLVVLWGNFFVGVPVRPNMLNMPKSASGHVAFPCRLRSITIHDNQQLVLYASMILQR